MFVFFMGWEKKLVSSELSGNVSLAAYPRAIIIISQLPMEKKPKVYKIVVLPSGKDAKPEELSMTKKQVTLEWLQDKVGGGNITTLPATQEGYVLVCNDEGLLRKLPENFLVPKWLPDRFSEEVTGYPIVGPVLVVPEKLM